MIRIIIALTLLLTAPAFAQSDRLTLLEQQYTLLEQTKTKAVRMHDHWLAKEQVQKMYPGLPNTATEVFTSREEWSAALRTIWHISDKLYPNEAGPALMTSPPEGLSIDTRMAHRKAAMPEIEALEKRITAEIASLKAHPQ